MHNHNWQNKICHHIFQSSESTGDAGIQSIWALCAPLSVLATRELKCGYCVGLFSSWGVSAVIRLHYRYLPSTAEWWKQRRWTDGQMLENIQHRHSQGHFFSPTTQQTRYIGPMLCWCWASVVDDGPTSAQHWPNVSCLLGSPCRFECPSARHMLFMRHCPRI